MMDIKYNQQEEVVLKEVDLLIEQAESQGEKSLYNIFKSAVLQKYKNRYDVEVLQGKVKKENFDKSIDFIFENACVRFRALPLMNNSDKENMIKQAKSSLDSWKSIVMQMLKEKGIEIV